MPVGDASEPQAEMIALHSPSKVLIRLHGRDCVAPIKQQGDSMPNDNTLWSRILQRFNFLDALRRASEPPLIDRGFGLIYDTERDITWLQDTNYAKTVHRSANGQLTWPDAMAWAAALNYRGIRGWRLPNARNQDGGGPAIGNDCRKRARSSVSRRFQNASEHRHPSQRYTALHLLDFYRGQRRRSVCARPFHAPARHTLEESVCREVPEPAALWPRAGLARSRRRCSDGAAFSLAARIPLFNLGEILSLMRAESVSATAYMNISTG